MSEWACAVCSECVFSFSFHAYLLFDICAVLAMCCGTTTTTAMATAAAAPVRQTHNNSWQIAISPFSFGLPIHYRHWCSNGAHTETHALQLHRVYSTDSNANKNKKALTHSLAHSASTPNQKFRVNLPWVGVSLSVVFICQNCLCAVVLLLLLLLNFIFICGCFFFRSVNSTHIVFGSSIAMFTLVKASFS